MTTIKNSSNASNFAFFVFALILGVPYSAFFWALAGWQFYQWFFIPLGAPVISGWHLAGIAMLVAYFRSRPDTHIVAQKTKLELTILMLTYPPITCFTYLVSGWIIAKLAGLA